MKSTPDSKQPLFSEQVGPSIAICLAGFGYSFKTSPDKAEFAFQIRNPAGRFFESRLGIVDAARVVRLHVRFRESPLGAARPAWVNSLIAEANHRLAVLGCFARGAPIGIYYQTAVRLDDEVNWAPVERLLNFSTFPVSVFDGALRLVGRPKVTPLDALNASLIEQNVSEGIQVGKGTRRALMTILK